MEDSIKNNQLNLLATRTGYNMALRHFRVVQEIAANVGMGYNLADLLTDILEEGRIEEHQIRPIVNMLLIDKYGYSVKSINLNNAVSNIDKLAKTVGAWTNIQLVMMYNGNNGLSLLNPENPEEWNDLLPLTQGSQIVCFASALEKTNYEIAEKAANDALQLLIGRKVKGGSGYKTTREVKRKVVKTAHLTPIATVSSQSSDAEMGRYGSNERQTEINQVSQEPLMSVGKSNKLTAKIGVNVTNELFHNGNVEAWKCIIQSYKVKFPDLDVLVWYDGEKINDLNSLFKWGKVKHGTPIMFSVAGENPAMLAKLKKYLFEGASSRFEAFLHGSPGSVLSLF